MNTPFDQAFTFIIGEEGGYTADPADPGNWTEGSVGQGTCNGTKFGISASAYPLLDIKNINVPQAKAIYSADYWSKAGCATLQPPLALIVFDGAVNSGPSRSVRWLQTAVGAYADGFFGPESLALVNAYKGTTSDLCAEVLAQRLMFMTHLPTWRTFGLGWSRRIANLPFLAAQMPPLPVSDGSKPA